jgi:cytochrome c peroxidase
MGFSAAEDVVPLLKQFGYEAAFKKTFPKDDIPLSPANYASAIQAYEETLVTPSAFDRFLKGDDDALSVVQKDGLELFIRVGCADCHNGPLLGGNSIQKFGIHKAYASATKSERHDEGVFETSKNESDRDHFRVSMLRNIAKTGPYFHDGSVEELQSAIRIMAEVQLDKQLTELEVKSVVSFLGSLTGHLPSNYGPILERAKTD